MIAKIKILACVAVCIAAFLAGYSLAANRYKAEIATMQFNAQKELASHEATLKKQLQAERDANAKATSELLSSLKEAQARNLDRIVDADRLRGELSESARRLSAAESTPCGAYAKRLAKCERLLSTGVGLVERGARLFEQCAIEKDGLSSYVLHY